MGAQQGSESSKQQKCNKNILVLKSINNCDLNITQNNRGYHFAHSVPHIVKSQSWMPVVDLFCWQVFPHKASLVAFHYPLLINLSPRAHSVQ